MPVGSLKSSESSNTCRKVVRDITDSMKNKIKKGMEWNRGQEFLHTDPHHNDIMLGLFPYVNKYLYSASNKSVFIVLTSCFTVVTIF